MAVMQGLARQLAPRFAPVAIGLLVAGFTWVYKESQVNDMRENISERVEEATKASNIRVADLEEIRRLLEQDKRQCELDRRALEETQIERVAELERELQRERVNRAQWQKRSQDAVEGYEQALATLDLRTEAARQALLEHDHACLDARIPNPVGDALRLLREQPADSPDDGPAGDDASAAGGAGDSGEDADTDGSAESAPDL